MSVIKPYTPIRVTEDEHITAEVILRTLTFGTDSLPTSILSEGEELLSAPLRIVGKEDGNPIEWLQKESFIYSRSEEELVVCGTMQSEQFIINTHLKLEFDGCLSVDLKLMPKGLTVAQVFGTDAYTPPKFRLDELILELPLTAKANLYHSYPNGPILGDEGVLIPQSNTSSSGLLPTERCWLPHRPLLWLGNENRGLCLFSESDENWQPADKGKAIEIVHDGEVRLVRIHLLDSHPQKWEYVPKGSSPTYWYEPLSFALGLEATPVKPFPEKPFLHNALHIDCFKKIEGDYKEYLAGDFDGENGYDRMKRHGVTTLVLHEKWNKMQNFPYLSEPTARQLETIIYECHKRGIKVIPYFGYEISSLSPLWTERKGEALMLNGSGHHAGGWWRVPPQRDYIVCYQSSWQDTFVEGIRHLITKYGFDGIYLDSTLNVNGCTNALHGCGYVDADGVIRPTWPLMAVRKMLRRLYEIVEPLGGIINYHSFTCCNIPAMGFTHLGWNGESIQFKLLKEGATEMPLDYFRAEYIGRNFGIPQELIAYENRPLWTFEQATSFAILHGILPRPNDIGGPLSFIANVWKIFDTYPLDKATWVPYWENREITTGADAIKCSYYRYVDIWGRAQLLVIVANTTMETCEMTLHLPNAKLLFGTVGEGNQMPPFSFGIYGAELPAMDFPTV